MILLSTRRSDPDMARDEDEAAQMAATPGANVYRFQTEDLKRGSSNAMGTDCSRNLGLTGVKVGSTELHQSKALDEIYNFGVGRFAWEVQLPEPF